MAGTYAAMIYHHPKPLVQICNSTYANWTFTVFGECVTNQIQLAGFILGLISIGFWIVVFIPQFYESYKTGRADQALSPLFLIMWLLGDMSNLIGCILSQQLQTQIYVAVYYIFMDVLILSQFGYYKWKNRKSSLRIPGDGNDSSCVQAESNHVIYCFALVMTFSWTGLMSWEQGHTIYRKETHTGTGRSLLMYDDGVPCLVYFGSTSQCMFYNDQDVIGYIFGVISGVCYFLSRTPQIFKNYYRRSVEGISVFMFVITVLGNLTYGLSIILEGTTLVFYVRHLPWLVGSIGTLIFDLTLLFQFVLYGRSKKGALNVGETQPLLA